MSISSQQRADLSGDSYKDYAVGRRGPVEDERVSINGTQYRVLEHANNPRTGYQGTIYQSVETGEIVVAHRGTEFDNEPVRDGLIADGGMVLLRSNAQARDAIELTGRALEISQAEGRRNGEAPQVTVTGHSLGGTLAQISAHHFDLKGETFNAYGAHSLGYRIPEGGHSMVNHVMAGDVVSAASGHYGEMRVHTSQHDIDALDKSGYENNDRTFLDWRNPINAAARNIGPAHKMENFLEHDAQGNPRQSILSDPRSPALSQEYAPMINKYRNDLEFIRQAVGVVADVGTRVGAVRSVTNAIRGDLEPGEPARREQAETERKQVHTPPAPAAVAAAGSRIDHPDHPGHGMYQQALAGVHRLDDAHGRAHDGLSNQMAGALAARSRQDGMTQIDSVVLSDDRNKAFAIQGDISRFDSRFASQPTLEALNQPLSHSSDAWTQADQQHRQEHAQQQVHAQQQAQQQQPHEHGGMAR